MHLDIKDGKIWIQHDGTEVDVDTILLEKGVPANGSIRRNSNAEVKPHVTLIYLLCPSHHLEALDRSQIHQHHQIDDDVGHKRMASDYELRQLHINSLLRAILSFLDS